VSAAFIFLLLVLNAMPAQLLPADFMQDDSYFYLQIAGHIVDGDGSTFHKVTPTNGYHPFWMAITVAAMYLAGGDKTAALHIVSAAQALLFLGTAIFYWRLCRLMDLRYWLIGFAIVSAYLLGTGIFGSEAHLNACMLTGGMVVLWRAIGSSRFEPWFVAGVVLGLAVLARLDNIIVVSSLVMCTVFYPQARDIRHVGIRVIATALGGALVVVPYLLSNELIYGHLMPISGAIKSTFPVFDLDFNRLGTLGKLAAFSGVVTFMSGLVLEKDLRRRVLWIGLGLGVVLHAIYVIGFTDHFTFWAWYYVSGVLSAGLIGTFLADWIALRLRPVLAESHVRVLAYLFAALLLSTGAVRAWAKAFNPIRFGPISLDIRINNYRWPQEVGAWMGDHLPPDSSVFVYDWPGALAYYSGLNIVPMDGLVNDFEYNDDILARGVMPYLCQHEIHYFFGLLEPESDPRYVSVNAPLYRKNAGTLTLKNEDIVVKIREIVSRPDEALPFAIWRLNCQ